MCHTLPQLSFASLTCETRTSALSTSEGSCQDRVRGQMPRQPSGKRTAGQTVPSSLPLSSGSLQPGLWGRGVIICPSFSQCYFLQPLPFWLCSCGIIQLQSQMEGKGRDREGKSEPRALRAPPTTPSLPGTGKDPRGQRACPQSLAASSDRAGTRTQAPLDLSVCLSPMEN